MNHLKHCKIQESNYKIKKIKNSIKFYHKLYTNYYNYFLMIYSNKDIKKLINFCITTCCLAHYEIQVQDSCYKYSSLSMECDGI